MDVRLGLRIQLVDSGQIITPRRFAPTIQQPESEGVSWVSHTIDFTDVEMR
jgi:hypothetical protein